MLAPPPLSSPVGGCGGAAPRAPRPAGGAACGAGKVRSCAPTGGGERPPAAPLLAAATAASVAQQQRRQQPAASGRQPNQPAIPRGCLAGAAAAGGAWGKWGLRCPVFQRGAGAVGGGGGRSGSGVKGAAPVGACLSTQLWHGAQMGLSLPVTLSSSRHCVSLTPQCDGGMKGRMNQGRAAHHNAAGQNTEQCGRGIQCWGVNQCQGWVEVQIGSTGTPLREENKCTEEHCDHYHGFGQQKHGQAIMRNAGMRERATGGKGLIGACLHSELRQQRQPHAA